MATDQTIGEESLLRLRAREAIGTGALPSKASTRVFGGPGSGQRCALCQQAIGQEELEFELVFALNGVQPRTHHLHVHCFVAWERECGTVHAVELSSPSRNGTMAMREHSEPHDPEAGG